MKAYIAVFTIGILVRIAAFFTDLKFGGDVYLFQAWAVLLFEGGLPNFYYSDMFTDYTPVYMYVLWGIGALRHLLGDLPYMSREFNMLVFAPAVISDMVTGMLLLLICRRVFYNDGDFGKPFWITLAYLLNPAVIINSSMWGQVDAIHTLLLFVALYALHKYQTLPVYLLYGFAVLTKPHSLIVAPIFLYSAFLYFKERNYSIKAAFTVIGYGIATFVFMALLIAPFTWGLNFVSLWQQYSQYLGTRPFASINAYNFYAMLGGNWQSISPFFNFVTIVAIVGVSLMTFWILHKRWDRISIFFCAALLFIITFNFSVQMHERYLFPALLFLLVAAVFMHQKNPKSRRFIVLYIGFTITFTLNCLDVLLSLHGINLLRFIPLPDVFMPVHGLIALVSFASVAMAVYSLRTGGDVASWTE